MRPWMQAAVVFLKTSVTILSCLSLAIYGGYSWGLLDFNTQLQPMVDLSLIIAILAGLIKTTRDFPTDYDLLPPDNSMLMPARVLPSNHSRKAPPAVDV